MQQIQPHGLKTRARYRKEPPTLLLLLLWVSSVGALLHGVGSRIGSPRVRRIAWRGVLSLLRVPRGSNLWVPSGAGLRVATCADTELRSESLPGNLELEIII